MSKNSNKQANNNNKLNGNNNGQKATATRELKMSNGDAKICEFIPFPLEKVETINGDAYKPTKLALNKDNFYRLLLTEPYIKLSSLKQIWPSIEYFKRGEKGHNQTKVKTPWTDEPVQRHELIESVLPDGVLLENFKQKVEKSGPRLTPLEYAARDAAQLAEKLEALKEYEKEAEKVRNVWATLQKSVEAEKAAREAEREKAAREAAENSEAAREANKRTAAACKGDREKAANVAALAEEATAEEAARLLEINRLLKAGKLLEAQALMTAALQTEAK